jgi:hypothetical protein
MREIKAREPLLCPTERRTGRCKQNYVKYFTKFLHGEKTRDNIRGFKVSCDWRMKKKLVKNRLFARVL